MSDNLRPQTERSVHTRKEGRSCRMGRVTAVCSSVTVKVSISVLHSEWKHLLVCFSKETFLAGRVGR